MMMMAQVLLIEEQKVGQRIITKRLLDKFKGQKITMFFKEKKRIGDNLKSMLRPMQVMQIKPI